MCRCILYCFSYPLCSCFCCLPYCRPCRPPHKCCPLAVCLAPCIIVLCAACPGSVNPCVITPCDVSLALCVVYVTPVVTVSSTVVPCSVSPGSGTPQLVTPCVAVPSRVVVPCVAILLSLVLSFPVLLPLLFPRVLWSPLLLFRVPSPLLRPRVL